MKKLLKSLLILALVVGATVAFAAETPANTNDGTGFFGHATTRFMTAFRNVRTMVLIFGGFGLVVLAVAAILGKVKWAALGALAAGLAIVAVAGKVVDYAAGISEDEESYGSTDMNIGQSLAGGAAAAKKD